MIYLKFTYVDSATKVSIYSEPAQRGPVFPSVAGLTFGFALESQYPTDRPVLYGTADDGADITMSGVLEQVTPGAYEAARLAELEARAALVKVQMAERITSTRYAKETGGFGWGDFTIATDPDSSAKIRSEREAAKDGRRKDTDVWKLTDTDTGQAMYRQTTNEEMVAIGDAAYFRTQACYAREAELMAALADGRCTSEMIAVGWPA